MRTYLECIPCFLKQALFAARAATNDEKKIKEVLDRVGLLIPEIPLTSPPPETASLVYPIVREITGVLDPYKGMKEKNIREALKIYSSMKALVEAADDPLQMAVKISIAGNSIDFGANPGFDFEAEVKEAIEKDFSLTHFEAFKRRLDKARNILFLGDNAGETVFDRILIETMRKPVTYVVREKPIINDATLEDAINSGLNEVAEVIPSGCDAPGTILSRCSKNVLQAFRNSDLIISKGQGNFEGLSEEKGPIFFLLMVKCPVIARHTGLKEGELVLMQA